MLALVVVVGGERLDGYPLAPLFVTDQVSGEESGNRAFVMIRECLAKGSSGPATLALQRQRPD